MIRRRKGRLGIGTLLWAALIAGSGCGSDVSPENFCTNYQKPYFRRCEEYSLFMNLCYPVTEEEKECLDQDESLSCQPRTTSYCCCEKVVSDEYSGVSIIIDELKKRGYEAKGNNEGEGLQHVTLINPNTGDYELVVVPDVIFWKEGSLSYSYFEFHSSEDPCEEGGNFSSDFPFYRVIPPDTETFIRMKVRNYVGELEKIIGGS